MKKLVIFISLISASTATAGTKVDCASLNARFQSITNTIASLNQTISNGAKQIDSFRSNLNAGVSTCVSTIRTFSSGGCGAYWNPCQRTCIKGGTSPNIDEAYCANTYCKGVGAPSQLADWWGIAIYDFNQCPSRTGGFCTIPPYRPIPQSIVTQIQQNRIFEGQINNLAATIDAAKAQRSASITDLAMVTQSRTSGNCK